MLVTISVVVPSFNRGYCLAACVSSILAQTFTDFEVIVVDDASTDDTREVVASMRDPRVRYLAHPENRGGAAARNTGIQASAGEFVAFLDSDDRWQPKKLERQLAYLADKGDAYGFVYSWFIGRDKDGREVWRMNQSIDGLALEALLCGNAVGTFSSVLARRSVLDAVGGLDADMRSCQDWDLFVRLNAITKVGCVEEYLVDYLQNPTDKFRISANPASIMLGHSRMLAKMEERLLGVSPAARVAALKHFTQAFASAGAVREVVRTGSRVLAAAPTPWNAAWLLVKVLGAMRRVTTGKFGY